MLWVKTLDGRYARESRSQRTIETVRTMNKSVSIRVSNLALSASSIFELLSFVLDGIPAHQIRIVRLENVTNRFEFSGVGIEPGVTSELSAKGKRGKSRERGSSAKAGDKRSSSNRAKAHLV